MKMTNCMFEDLILVKTDGEMAFKNVSTGLGPIRQVIIRITWAFGTRRSLKYST